MRLIAVAHIDMFFGSMGEFFQLFVACLEKGVATTSLSTQGILYGGPGALIGDAHYARRSIGDSHRQESCR